MIQPTPSGRQNNHRQRYHAPQIHEAGSQELSESWTQPSTSRPDCLRGYQSVARDGSGPSSVYLADVPLHRSQSTALPRTAPSSRWSSPPPPLHSRPLYANIPLPHVDAADRWEEYQDQQTSFASRGVRRTGCPIPSEVAMPDTDLWRRPIQQPPFPNHSLFVRLHPVLEAIYLSAHQILSDVPRTSSSLPSSPIIGTQYRDEPATEPGVAYLIIQVHSTADNVIVRPSSPTSPHIVTVGDVLAGLQHLYMISDHKCHRRCRSTNQTGSCQCDRIILTMNSLQLWWAADEDVPERPQAWKLVVRRQ